jgi:hypothetical protein
MSFCRHSSSGREAAFELRGRGHASFARDAKAAEDSRTTRRFAPYRIKLAPPSLGVRLSSAAYPAITRSAPSGCPAGLAACGSRQAVRKPRASQRMPDGDQPAYRTEGEKDRFSVMDDGNRVIVVCRDKGSADQYASVLNEAFKKGFKAGFRKGKGQTPSA